MSISRFLEFFDHVDKSGTIGGVFWRYADRTSPIFSELYTLNFLNARF